MWWVVKLRAGGPERGPQEAVGGVGPQGEAAPAEKQVALCGIVFMGLEPSIPPEIPALEQFSSAENSHPG